MKIIDKIRRKSANSNAVGAITIAFLGDSVTQGCFETYVDEAKQIQPVYDSESGYANDLKKVLSFLFPSVPVNVVNAGISGNDAVQAHERIQRDVIAHTPDLTVVCLGLNDSTHGMDGIPTYCDVLCAIFDSLQEHGTEIIFMTPNTMNSMVSAFIHSEEEKAVAVQTAQIQNAGILEAYLKAAKRICHEKRIPVCDCYEKWMKLSRCGVDTTVLLANKINHPVREMHWLFAYSLLETMMDE